MARGIQTAKGVAVLALTLSLAGCGSNKVEDVPLDQLDAESIFQLGEQSLESERKAENAVYYFSEVERLYPYSEMAKRALIMQAYGYHKDKDYENSRAAAQRYIDTYPAEEDAAYAKYLLALSYYDQIDEVGRDQGLTFQALQALRAVIEEYPDSDYARSAILKFDLAFDHLAAKAGDLPLLLAPPPFHRRDQPFPRGGRTVPDHDPHRRGACTPDRMLSVAWPDGRSADGRCDPWLQLPLDAVVRGSATVC